MRSSAFILAALALTSSAYAALRFTPAVELEGSAIAVPLLKGGEPLPLEMPDAESYLVSRDGEDRRIVDRYSVLDLWTGQSVVGRWIDADGTVLTLARLDVRLPSDPSIPPLERGAWLARRVALGRDDEHARDEAVKALSPVDLSAPVKPRRSQRRNFDALVEYPALDGDALVWAWCFKIKEKGDYGGWWMASLEPGEGVRMEEARARWDEDFLDGIVGGAGSMAVPPGKDATEGELLKFDRRRSVAAYDEWHAAETGSLSILDDIDPVIGAPLVSAITNELPILREAFAKSAPSPLDIKDSIASMRLFATREEYLMYVGGDAEWSAGQWDPVHRELAAWLPPGEAASLERTLRHEAFHQYLAYACAFAQASPWFNEGHAEMFERVSFDGEGGVEVEMDDDAALFIRTNAESLAGLIPALMLMDYRQFYDGSDEARSLKYRLAWSIAYFLEKGAPKVRNRPFEGVRARYLKTLVDTRSMLDATRLVFNGDMTKLLVTEWLKFWTD